jgi:hypothetical protein
MMHSSSNTFFTTATGYIYSFVSVQTGMFSYTYSSSPDLIQLPAPMTKAEISREKMKKYLILLPVDQNYMPTPSLNRTAPSFDWRVHRMRGIRRRTRQAGR